jgi:hypothetical protein
MREVSHLVPEVPLPPRRDALVNDLPWMRRERADANIRRAIGELRALAVEDSVWVPQYLALADAFESAVSLLDAIEDFESQRHSRRVDT